MSWFSGKQTKINTDPKLIEEILERGVHSVLPDKESLRKLLSSGKRIRFYLGMDATGPDIHLGHTKALLVVEKLRKLGHEAIILFGDFTAQIGDPTDKEATRVRLTPHAVDINLRTWDKQARKIVGLSGENPARIVKNSAWLAKLTFAKLIDLSANFTVQQMIERDMFEKRINEGKPIYLHEFFYPLMQGYDSVVLDVDLEIGGSDQIFNMLAGRTLQKKIRNREKFVLATTLLENPETGKKLMSKSAGDYIPLEDDPENMYGKVMSLPDEVVAPLLIEDTKMDWEEAKDFVRKMKAGEVHPKEAKMKLAWEIVKMCHSESAANLAQDSFVSVFKEGSLPENIPTVEVDEETSFLDAIEKSKIVESKSEIRRLAKDGAIEDVESKQKINTLNFIISKPVVLKIGKKKFMKIIIRKK